MPSEPMVHGRARRCERARPVHLRAFQARAGGPGPGMVVPGKGGVGGVARHADFVFLLPGGGRGRGGMQIDKTCYTDDL